MTQKKKPAVPLKANVPTIKSASKLPVVKTKLEYFEFDAYADAARMMLSAIDQIQNHEDGKTVFFGNPAHSYREFDAGRKIYEREEFHRKRKMRPCIGSKHNRHSEHEITRRVVTEKVGLLIGSFPNAGPHNPETYMGMLIEEIIAANPSASALEATCRELRRSKNFAPSTAEVLKELHKQSELWDECLCIWEDDIEWCVKEHARLIEAAKAKEAKEAEEKRLAEEREKERREKWERERPEREARQREERERQERERQEREAREAEERCQKFVNAQLQKLAKEAEVESVWYWFQLLLMSRGIFISIEVLARIRREKLKETIRKLKGIRIRDLLEADDE